VKRVRRINAIGPEDARKLALDILPLTDGTNKLQVVQVLPADPPGNLSNLLMDRSDWKPF
jgi:hypothetical protein